jgi:hypothetical protein
MPKLTWKVVNETQTNLDITQYVRSLSFTQGRPSPLSPYSGNSASITMLSYGGIENNVAINDTIRLEATPTGGVLWQIFEGFVTSRTFDDNPGTGINSLMTVSLNDPMLQAGMANFQNQSLVSVNNQIDEIVADLPQIPIFSNGTDVDISVGSFTTNANQRINEIIAGDRGVLQSDSGNNAYTKPSDFDLIVYNSLTFGRTTSATQIAYQDLVRVEAASNNLFYTQATVTGSASTETKTADVGAFFYGRRTFTASTAQSNLVAETAEWYANAFSDPETVMLNLSFSDVAQNETALQEFAELLSINMFVQVSYTPPGGVSTTGYYWPEQITVNATPEQTSITMLMSPLTYYANFILDDAVFGVLDTDRLGV